MAVAHFFIDHANGNDAAGDGSLGNPWKTIQHAQDNAVRGSNGTQFNCRSNAPHPVTPGLNLATYTANNGSLSNTLPVIYRGFDNAADDGGRATLAIGGTHQLFGANNYNYISLIDLNVEGTASASVTTIQLGIFALVARCVVSGNPGSGRIKTGNSSAVINCHVFSYAGMTVAGVCIEVGAGSLVLGCYVDGRGNAYGIFGATNASSNIIVCKESSTGIYSLSNGVISNNTIWAFGGSGRGIYLTAASVVVINNLVSGFSTFGTGIQLTGAGSVAINNAAYNCMTPYTLSGLPMREFGNVVLDNDPFVDAANGNFSINGNVPGVTEAAWPQDWPGLVTDMLSRGDVGAVQAGAGEGGGGGLMYPIIGASFIRGAA